MKNKIVELIAANVEGLTAAEIAELFAYNAIHKIIH